MILRWTTQLIAPRIQYRCLFTTTRRPLMKYTSTQNFISLQWTPFQHLRAFSQTNVLRNGSQTQDAKVEEIEQNKQKIKTEEPKKEELKTDEKEKSKTEEPKKEELKKEIDPKDEKIATLNQQIVDLRNNLKIALAEIENVRKRLQKEVDKAREFGVEKLIKNLFPVIDTINICLQNKPNFSDKEVGANVEAKIAFDALESTKTQFLTIFKDSYGIEEYVPKMGETFDPMIHNALFEVDPPEGTNIPPGTIGVVAKYGWKRNGILLRCDLIPSLCVNSQIF